MDNSAKPELPRASALKINTNLARMSDAQNSPLGVTETGTMSATKSPPRKVFPKFKTFTNRSPNKNQSGALTSRESRDGKLLLD